ncbi:response regulator [Cohnella thailandensis]|uniref:Response regulator n=1 Tax=Cohnella thailandensis TaxID=557557 RepID=A0A841SNV0_9BACL|nr:response regulator [Cohnella thailandensis]MBB6632862.1 response regulator [Cohnella thailandensis]MBP1975444.1 two-component system response regulator YesN [Cohnella thailandensis]
MHSVLIIDDDAMIVRGLEQFVDWPSMGFRIVGTARDGEEGLQAIRELRPDIVLTDIKMPYKDGLSMIEDCLNDGLSPHFVVLTGFDEFEYARRALKSRVSDYLLKPVEENKLIPVLNGIREQIREAERKRADWSALESRAKENDALIREKLILDLVSGQLPPESMDADKQTLHDIRLSGRSNRVALVEGDRTLLVDPKLTEMMTAVFGKLGVHAMIARAGDSLTLLLNGKPDGERSLGEGLEEMMTKASEWLGLSLTVGVSNAGAAAELPDLYKQAELALQYKMYTGSGSVNIYRELSHEAERMPNDPQEQARRLLAAVSENNEPNLQAELDEFFGRIRRQGGLPPQSVYRMCSEVLYEIRKGLNEIGMPADDFVGEPAASVEGMAQHGTLDELRQGFGAIFQRIGAYFDRSPEHAGGEQIDSILLFMRTHYAEPIDLDVISRTFFIDPSYFCKVFKKSTGVTYLHYLTKIRMDKACQLLSHPASKVYEIAGKVGYEDQRYFSQVFRKHTGMTPSDYQKSKTKI